jgi:DNA-binding CsgD family transcriptional regulator
LCACGFLAQATGDYDDALAAFEEARQVAAEAGGERELAYAGLGLGLARLREGQPESALQSLAASRETMRRIDDPMGHALSLAFLATALDGAGQLAEARQVTLEGLHASERAGDTFVRGFLNALLGIVEWQLGDLEAAETRLQEALRTQQQIGHRLGIAESIEALGWVAASTGRMERASRLVGAAAAMWEELGNALLPTSQPHHDACGEAARAALGETRYDACLEEGRALGRGPDVTAALEETGQDTHRTRAMSTEHHPFELTARELEVARLVAEGLSNPAIAKALFLSPATIKSHVSHILRKLVLESRVQLAGWIAANDPRPAAPDAP